MNGHGDKRISEIVVAGGGIAGWSAAAALKRRVPGVSVTLVSVPAAPDALAERIMSTLPSIVGFHGDIGLRETDTVLRAGSGFRLGTCFEDWAKDRPSFVHAYGNYGRPFGATSFHHVWARAARGRNYPAFDRHSPAAAIARAGRFVPPQQEEGSPLSGFEFGLQLNLPVYAAMMQAYASHLGVRERPGRIADVRLAGEDGFVEALRLEDGGEVTGHLFVDCTGPAATVRSALGGKIEDWSRWLPCDRLLLADAPPPPDPPALDTVVAMPAGWRWQAASPVRSSHGLVYSAAHLSDGKAERALRQSAGCEPESGPIPFRSGRRSQPWLRNCVAIGDAAVSVEPLEWTNLHLVHSAVDRIVAMMPDRDCAPVELWDYNRQSAAEADRIRDFLVLHYATANRPSQPFWQEAASAEPPDSLAHTLALFRERGRLPFHEEETFSRDSWLAVLLGAGIVPRRIDPLVDALPPEQAEQSMARMRQTIDALVPSLPTQVSYLQSLTRQAR